MEELENCSCDPTHFGFSWQVEDGAPQEARSEWGFGGSCRNLVFHTRAWWRTHSLDLPPGVLDLDSKVLLSASKVGSGSVELQGGGGAEKPERSEGSSGSGHREDDQGLQAEEWSSWLLHFL